MPPGVTPGDVAELERQLWLRGFEQFFDSLRAARECVAVICADMPELEPFCTDDGTMQAGLANVLGHSASSLSKLT